MYPLNNLQICNRALLHIVTVLYITSQNLFYCLKFLPLDYQQNILRTAEKTTLSNVGEDGEPWGLPYTVPGPVNWISHFGRQCVPMSYDLEDTHTLGPAIPLLETCATHSSETIPSGMAYKVHQQLNGKIYCGIIIWQNAIKQWAWKSYSSLQLCIINEMLKERMQTQRET